MMGTLAVFEVAPTVIDVGTVAIAGLSELSVNVRPPAGAGALRVSVTGVGVVSGMLAVLGKVAVSETLMLRMSEAKPGALAVTVVDPKLTPVICGFSTGIWKPAGMKTLGVTVATEGLLLAKLTVKPPDGAATPRLRARLVLWPRETVGIWPMLMSELVPVTLAEPAR